MRTSSKARRRSSKVYGAAAVCCVLLCVAAALSMAPAYAVQPEQNRPDPENAAPSGPNTEEARASALQRLDNRLEWTRRMVDKFAEAERRMLEAKRRIAAGEDPEPIMQELRRKDSPNFRLRISHESEGREHAEAPSDESKRWHDRRRGDGSERFPPATPEQKVRVDQMLDTVIPDLSQRLKVICETQPERCQEEYDRLAYRMHHIIQDGVADQALFDLRLDDMRVSARVVPAAKRLAGLLQRQERLMTSPQPVPDDLVREIADARQSLKTLLAEQFDIRSRIREEERAKLQRELDRIQQQIQQLDAAIARDGRDRERIIQKQMDEALQQAREGRGGPIEPFREPQRAD